MLDALVDPFRSSFMQRALLEVVILSLACGPLGVWVLAFRQTYAAESMAHAMLPGLVLAALAGLPLVLGATGGVIVAAACIAIAARDDRVGTDAGVAVAITALFGLGAVLALSPDVPPRLGELLFGDLLGVTSGDLVTAAVLVVAVSAALAVGFRALSLSAFDAISAPSLGSRPPLIGLLLLVLLGLTTVAVVQGLGNLLAVALIVAPAAAALRATSRLPGALALATVLAALAGVAGLYLSYHLDLAGGASVALCACGVFALSLLRGAGGPVGAARHPAV